MGLKRCLAIAIALAALAKAAQADPVEDFYRGKTFTVLVGVGAGGEYDLQMRLIGRYIGKYIPGHPTVITQNMLGATGLVMANYLFNVAPKDGTSIGLIQNGLTSYQAMGVEGIQFDAAKFNWIGAIAPTVETMAVWKGAHVDTIEQARAKPLTAGANGRSGITYTFPKLLNEIAGTKFKIITGYQTVNEINIAMERGEVEARNNAWSSWKAAKPEWVRDGDIKIIAIAGPQPQDLPGVPSVEGLGRNDDDKALAALVTSGARLGHPFAAAPGVPAERVRALRDAFAAVTKDPDFLADAKQASVEIEPVTGQALQQIVDQVLATPPQVRKRGRALID